MPDGPSIFYRVDPRFVHATLMNAWLHELGAEWIIIADEHVEADVRQRTIFEMSTMDAAQILFVSETQLHTALRSITFDAPVVVLFGSLESARAAIRSGLEVDELNLGHVPRSASRTQVHPAVHLDDGDRATIADIEATGTQVVIQPLPNDPRKSVDGRILPVREAPSQEVAHGPVRGSFEIVNERGLHLRAAHVLANLASRIEANVHVGRNGELVNAKSLLGLTTLGAPCGAFLDVVIDGPNAAADMEEVRKLFASGFDEGSA